LPPALGWPKIIAQGLGMTVKFTSTAGYVVPDDLALAVNAAVALGRPLLVKGEPGTGKTELARRLRPVWGWN